MSMTIEEIKNTPELIDYFLDESLTANSRKKLHKRMDEICNLAIKTLEQDICLSSSENQNKWHKEPPKKGGRYLVWWRDRVKIANYADNLYRVDKYDFEGKKRAGWYNYDGEYGYYELENVLRWQELPSDYKENEDGE